MISSLSTRKFVSSLICSTALIFCTSQMSLGIQSVDRKETPDPYFQPAKQTEKPIKKTLPQVRQLNQQNNDWIPNKPPSKKVGSAVSLGGLPVVKNGSIIRDKTSQITDSSNSDFVGKRVAELNLPPAMNSGFQTGKRKLNSKFRTDDCQTSRNIVRVADKGNFGRISA